MAYTDKLSELVQTVRVLNWEVRPRIDNTPGGDPPGNPLFTALADLRRNEIQISRVMRGISLDEDTDPNAASGSAVEDAVRTSLGARQILSEFATARETILSLLRVFTEEQWTREYETPSGRKTVEDIVDGLIEFDQTINERIKNATG